MYTGHRVTVDDIGISACLPPNAVGGLLYSEVLFRFWIKGQVLHCKGFHLTVHGWLSEFSAALQARKCPWTADNPNLTRQYDPEPEMI